jgi:TRAP-type C4-dicarboxylate transport system permease small subunit
LNRLVRLLFEVSLLLLGCLIAVKGLDLVQTNLDIEATSMPISASLLYVPLIPAGVVMMMQAVLDAMAIWQEKPTLQDGGQP